MVDAPHSGARSAGMRLLGASFPAIPRFSALLTALWETPFALSDCRLDGIPTATMRELERAEGDLGVCGANRSTQWQSRGGGFRVNRPGLRRQITVRSPSAQWP